MFDFDGVIANSEPLHCRTFRDVLDKEGVTVSESDYYTRYLGFDDAGAFAAVAADRGRLWSTKHIANLVRHKAALLEELECDQSMLFPGSRAAIRRLAAACPLGIASGSLRQDIMRVLEREHLVKHFAAVVAAEDTSVSKPAPDPYVRAVDRLSVATGLSLTPSECVAVEDSEWGIDSARAAGLRTVAITHTYPATALPGADLVIAHLDTLTLELLSSIDDRVRPAGHSAF